LLKFLSLENMKEYEKTQKVNYVFESVLKSIENEDHLKISESFKDLNKIEIDFLNGHISRKKEGAYYTQESISNFIVSQAIILYINRFLENSCISSLEDIYNLNDNFRSRIKEKLLNLSILDPACGSGVFLLSASSQIFGLMRNLEPELDTTQTILSILENMFGSEINDYARKLCIMKLFKWAYNKKTLDNSMLFTLLNSNISLEDSLKTKKNSKYDLVVGNPPYGNILDENQKERLKLEKIFYNDIYCAFIIKSLEWTDDIIGYLVPKSFLLRQGYVKFRKNLFSQANLLKIYDVGPNLFAKATNEVQILFYERRSDGNKDLDIFQYPNTAVISYPAQGVDSLRICFNKSCPLNAHEKKIYAYISDLNCPFCNSDTLALNRIRVKPNKIILDLINKIETTGDLNYLNIKRIPSMIRGEESKGLKEVIDIVEQNTKNSCFFIKAKGDFNYYYFKKEKSFDIEKLDPKILKGHNFEYYKNPKLLIKHNSIFPQSVFSEENVCFTSSIYSIISDDHVELKYINALLNSSLMQFYCFYGINNQQTTTINLNQYMIRHLPIMNVSSIEKNRLSEYVQIIINSLMETNGIYTKKILDCAKKVDNIVFDLYKMESNERELIISDIKGKIDYYKKVYS
ncbi:MAG: Eco57I restriction-modification methylase domain-containing protein, partial [Candidatus Hermodarchaeota archaeon]